jgi:NADH-quinone oxidoreductase subunit N
MLSVAVKRSHEFAAIITLLAYGASFISLFGIRHLLPRQITPLIYMDTYGVFYLGLLSAASLFVAVLSYNYLYPQKGNKEEYYILLLLGTLGASVLVVSNHFVSFFLGLEILSVALYVMISYLREREAAIEAGIKYLILAGVSSAFLLFGMALVYTYLGALDFPTMAQRFSEFGLSFTLAGGVALMIVGIGFKLAVVPFHMWTPDVYQGASAPVTAFIATVSKGGVFAFVFRLFIELNAHEFPSVILSFSIIAVASMLLGNILALLQNNVKRILAYSSIAHLGYLLVAFIAAGQMGVEAATFYLTAYFITILGSFGVITVLSSVYEEAESLNYYSGLFWRKPWISLLFTAMLLSLAGIPLTAGFIGKFYVAAAGVSDSLWVLVIVLIISSVIGLFYYLRIIAAMFSSKDETAKNINFAANPIEYGFGGAAALLLLFVLLIYFGVFPSGIMAVIKNMVVSLP